MKKALFALFLLASVACAIDLNGLAPIAPYASTPASVTLTCRDHSQIRLYLLAPDLVRVRASFGRALPERDHSWAIAKTEWDAPPYRVLSM